MTERVHEEPNDLSAPVRRRVLVSEDDPSIRTMLNAVLSRRHLEVVSAADGVETIARLDDPFDVIILDLMMPAMSGYDVLDHLQKTNPALLKRTIVVTANAAVARQPGQIPAAALFVKPFDIVEFMAAVTRIAADS